MLGAAKEGKWDKVVELEIERSSRLEILSAKLASTGQSHAITARLRQTITAIIDSDKEVVMLAAAQKDILAQEARDLGSSRKAVNAYLDNR